MKTIVDQTVAKGYGSKIVYASFNEPDGNWYGGLGSNSTVQSNFCNDWLTIYKVIKAEDSNARIAGSNLACYSKMMMDTFVKFCMQNNCMPDVITWHDLADWQFSAFSDEYNHYRSLEQTYGVTTPREIIINEYAAQSDCSAPGKLVKWIGLFEDYKVSACLPYWHISNNLDDIAADTNEANGAWWLYKWYGDMSGESLPVTQQNTARTALYGVASLDDNKKVKYCFWWCKWAELN